MNPQHWIATDVGVVREHNEDAYLWLGPEQTGGFGYLWLVCDGMGGETSGELAAATVIHSVREVYPVAMQRLRNPHRAMTEALNAANRRLLHMQKRNPALHKMGTTAVALAAWEGRAWIAYVGDSRAYVLHQGRLHQLTRDHTKLEKMLELGVLKPEEAPNHPSGNVLLRAMGRDGMEVDTCGDRTLPLDDRAFILCSDGLSSFVSTDHMEQALLRLYARDATESLIELARRNWSDDNITCGVVRFVEPVKAMITRKENFLKWVSEGMLDRSREPATLQLASTAVMRSLVETPPETSVTFDPNARWESHKSGAQQLLPPQVVESLFNPPPDPAPTAGPVTAPQPSPRGPATTPQRSSDTASPFMPITERGLPATSVPQQTSGASTHNLPAGERAARVRGHDWNAADPDTDPGSRHGRHLGHNAGALQVDGDLDDAPRTSWGIIGGVAVIIVGAVLAAWFISRIQHPEPTAEQLAATSRGAEYSADQGTDPDTAQRVDPGAGTGISAATTTVDGDDTTPGTPSDDSVYVWAPEPRDPDITWTRDDMPAFVISREPGALLIVDAHEVTVSQIRRALEHDAELRSLHREVDAPRYADLPCSSGASTDLNDPREPACVSAESATRYCSQQGRRLATRDDWRRILPVATGFTHPGHPSIRYVSADGPPSPVPAPATGLMGVYDGLAETLAASELDLARGDIALLRPRARTPDSDPTTTQSGLRTQLLARSLPASAVPMLGFRCVFSGNEQDMPAYTGTIADSAQAQRRDRALPRSADPVSSGNGGNRVGVIAPRELTAASERSVAPDVVREPSPADAGDSNSFILDRLHRGSAP